MIRLTIQRKGFLATFALTTTMALLLVFAMRWNLEQGFERYTTAAEFARLSWLIQNIESEYAAHGNWDFLKARPEQTWRRLLRPRQDGGFNAPLNRPPMLDQFSGGSPDAANDNTAPGLPPPPPPPPWEVENSLQPNVQNTPANRLAPPNDILRVAPRLALLDIDGTRLAGNFKGGRALAERPIMHNGALVGRISLQPSPSSVGELDAAFLASQTRNLLLFGVAALGLSLLAAWVLARHLLAPIRDLATGVRKIADGGLDARIPVYRADEAFLGETRFHE